MAAAGKLKTLLYFKNIFVSGVFHRAKPCAFIRIQCSHFPRSLSLCFPADRKANIRTN